MRCLRMSVSRSECSETRLQRLANKACSTRTESTGVSSDRPQHENEPTETLLCTNSNITPQRGSHNVRHAKFKVILNCRVVALTLKKAGEPTKVSKQLLL